ncbi:hypothetical protein [Corynebacterium pacaense]|uniref:hypothetical protein n=1 Tax=Corynebacterium pacaense TaxID=1816684 RepID=UPI0009BC2FDD|nr:hypothetical protein [Corynebacterium pacaense]
MPSLRELPLSLLGEIALLSPPTEDSIRALLLADARMHAADLLGVLEGRTPAPVPAPMEEPQPSRHGPSSSRKSLADLIREQHAANHRVIEVDPADFEDIGREFFADFLYGEQSGNPHGITLTQERDPADPDSRGSVLITWERLDVPATYKVIYRVIAADSEVSQSPDVGEQLVATWGTAFRDNNPGTGGMRHYMVWAHASAGNEAEMADAQPVLIGERAIAFPPENFKVNESNGVISGSWDPLEGHSAVRVYRTAGAGELTSPANELTTGVDAHGFTDRLLTRGLTYRFQLVPVVRFRGSDLTGEGGEVISKHVNADIQKVQLSVVERVGDGDNDRIVLSWIAPPTGSVKIFLSRLQPRPDLAMAAVDTFYIDNEEAFIDDVPTKTEEGEAGSLVNTDMPWPSEWHLVYVTPVNIVGERAWAGESSVLQRVSPINEVRLIERVNSQLLTFDWPAGAAFVEVAPVHGHSLELQEDVYRRQGGVRLNLASTGDTVTLTPRSIWKGDYTEAAPSVVRYRGLKRYSYDIEYAPGRSPQLSIWREGNPDMNPPQFILIYNDNRLPLDPDDGAPVQCQGLQDSQNTLLISPDSLQSGSGEGPAADPDQPRWWVDTRPLTPGGYFRLFIRAVGEPDPDAAERIVVERDVVSRLRWTPHHGGEF